MQLSATLKEWLRYGPELIKVLPNSLDIKLVITVPCPCARELDGPGDYFNYYFKPQDVQPLNTLLNGKLLDDGSKIAYPDINGAVRDLSAACLKWARDYNS